MGFFQDVVNVWATGITAIGTALGTNPNGVYVAGQISQQDARTNAQFAAMQAQALQEEQKRKALIMKVIIVVAILLVLAILFYIGYKIYKSSD